MAILSWLLGTLVVTSVIQFFLRRQEEAYLRSFLTEGIASGRFRSVTRNGRRVVYCFIRGENNIRSCHPVCIPGGLAATMATTGNLQEELVKKGFSVLMFDRSGVGLSDADNQTPSVDECVEEMEHVMKVACPEASQWMLMGPSMGSIVAQAYMIRHPERVSGFLNLDGLPHSFYLRRPKFLRAAKMYRVASMLTHVGLLRLVVFGLKKKMLPHFATDRFPVAMMAAQMNQPRFWSHVAVEMPLMMNLAEDVSTRGWRECAIESLHLSDVTVLSNLRPAHNGTYLGNGEWKELPRSNAELGSDWVSHAEAQDLLVDIRRCAALTPLGKVFATIPVKVMSARCFDYAGGDSFYDAEMKLFIAAEHNLHAIVALPGSSRVTFPTVGHDKLFLESECAVQCALDIQELSLQSKSIS